MPTSSTSSTRFQSLLTMMASTSTTSRRSTSSRTRCAHRDLVSSEVILRAGGPEKCRINFSVVTWCFTGFPSLIRFLLHGFTTIFLHNFSCKFFYTIFHAKVSGKIFNQIFHAKVSGEIFGRNFQSNFSLVWTATRDHQSWRGLGSSKGARRETERGGVLRQTISSIFCLKKNPLRVVSEFAGMSVMPLKQRWSDLPTVYSSCEFSAGT